MMITMRRIFYIILISLIFYLIGCVVIEEWTEALPIAIIGGCVGWAFTEFKRETGKK